MGGVGLVMAGAGARGAYEAGAVDVALRTMPESERPRVLIGTSAGAINALLLASLAHLPPTETGAQLVGRWQGADRATVLAPIAASGLGTLGRYTAELVGLPQPRLRSLLDNGPLRRTANDPLWIDWDQLHRNVESRLVTAVGVVATRVEDGSSVVFVEGDVELPAFDHVRGIEYVRTRLDASHLLASCAIPAAFPAELLTEPREAAGWYVDGGTRLNTPIKPALKLGADRLVVVATDPRARTRRPAGTESAPTVTDALAQLAHTVMADRMVEDLATLVQVNRILQAAGAPVVSVDRRYQLVPFRFLGPTDGQAIAAAARRVYDEEYGTVLQQLRRPDFPLLRRMLGGDGASADELLSFLFFERPFLRELVELGREDAEKQLAGAGEWSAH